ncbi:MAG: hypothetical protein ACRDRS_16905 [Pseudonocardiaceae bacterium]
MSSAHNAHLALEALMRHPDQWRGTGPRGRTDPTHPPQSQRASAGSHPERSRGSVVSRPGGRQATTAPGRAFASGGPIPATVWVGRGLPSDLDAGWPPPVVETTVTSFTDPGGHVVLLPWPTPVPITPGILDRELQDALTVVRGLDRTARVLRIEPEPGPRHPASSPYWADLVGDPRRVGDIEPAPRTGGWPTLAPDRFDGTAAGADLVITSLRPEHSGDRASDRVALAAARLLRTGGVLAVLTHCDWSRGQLVDPTGAVVAAAQNADLLYLQHIVVVHAPVRDSEFMIETETAGPGDNPRPQPATHRRIHADLLVFAQPHDHNLPSVTPAASAHQAEPLR